LFAGWTAIASAVALDEVPVWINTELNLQAERLGGIYGLGRLPFFDVQYTAAGLPEGVRIIDAEATSDTITIHYRGDWNDPSEPARLDVVRNLAHEMAHIRQRGLGRPTEDRFLHEGFAEAMAIEALSACGEPCAGGADRLLRERERQCGEALRDGPILSRDDEVAVYGCGSVFILAAARAADTNATDLYAAFVDAGRTRAALLDMIDETAGRTFTLSARSFLRGDYRLAPPRQTISNLREGRL